MTCKSWANIGIILVTESTQFILDVNVMSQLDFSVKVKSQTKKLKKEADRWTKEPAQEQRHTIPLLTS